MRLYAELGEVLDRNAIVIGDGGDFVSYAGRVIDSYEPGCWLDPGPFGCLGSGPGYALAAKLAHPERQVVLLLGDGAFGFSGMEFDTLARHGVNVVGVMGNNGIWALEKHPMEFLYGYSVAAELTPETRYDTVVEALGGHGALVRTPGELKPALEAAFSRRQAGAGQRAHRPRCRLPPQVEPGVGSIWPTGPPSRRCSRCTARRSRSRPRSWPFRTCRRCTRRPRTWRRRARRSGCVEQDGALAGGVGLKDDGDVLEIARLFVAPEWFRRGIGSALVQRAIDAAGGRAMVVGTGWTNAPALALYERFGFVRRDPAATGYVLLDRPAAAS